jgi:hypothetical protein
MIPAIANLLAALAEVENEMKSASAAWDKLKARHRKLVEEDIPTEMQIHGVKKLESDELVVEVVPDWSASISKAAKPDVCKYADELGVGDLVSHTITQQFKKDEADLYDQALKILNDNQQLYSAAENINTASWKKAVKELIASGKTIDLDRARVRRVNLAKVKVKAQH